MKTVHDTWENFRRHVLSRATPDQTLSAQMTFYAGASSMLDLILGRVGNTLPDESLEDGEKRLLALDSECLEFCANMASLEFAAQKRNAS